MKNIRSLWFKPWPRTLNTHRIYYVYFSFLLIRSLYIDPKFFSIFVCGPLQSFVVNNVCTLWDEITRAYVLIMLPRGSFRHFSLSAATSPRNITNLLGKNKICHPEYGGMGRGMLLGILGRGVRPVLQILTLFQTQKCNFWHPFSDLAFRQTLR